jgi:hypothetical protein
MAYATEGKFTLTAAASTVVADRLVYIDAAGKAALPNAATEAHVLALVGVVDARTAAGDVTVRGFDGGAARVAVAASQTVVAGNPLYLNSTTGTVATGASGWLVGTAVTGGVSGAQELAKITAILHKPILVTAET